MPHMEVMMGSEEGKYPETVTLDVTEEEVKTFNVGQKVEIVVKGSVGMVQVPPDGASEDNPPSIGVVVESKKIKGTNAFTELADDEEDEGE